MINTKLRFGAAAIALGVGLFGAEAFAQAPPTNVQGLESFRAAPGQSAGPLITFTAIGATTLDSAWQTSYGKNITCYLNITAKSGTIADTLAIQGQVPGGTNSFQVIISGSQTAAGVTAVSAGPNIATSSNVGANVVVPTVWRAELVSGTGTTPSSTGNVECYVGE